LLIISSGCYYRNVTLLKDTSLTKSLFEANEEALRLTNPLKEWVEELKQDPKLKSYLGYMPPKVDLNFLVNLVRDKGTLYPSYLIYCSKFSMKPLYEIYFGA